MKKLVKEALKSGDILNSTSNGLLARLIKKFTKSRINHTALVIEIWGDIFIIDSQKDGTNPRPFLEWMKMYNYKYQIHRPKEFTTEQKKRAVSKWGNTPYDFASLLLWQPIYIITGKWHGRKDPRADDRMYCSEYVAWVFELKDWWKLSPQAVFDSLQNDIRFELLD